MIEEPLLDFLYFEEIIPFTMILANYTKEIANKKKTEAKHSKLWTKTKLSAIKGIIILFKP